MKNSLPGGLLLIFIHQKFTAMSQNIQSQGHFLQWPLLALMSVLILNGSCASLPIETATQDSLTYHATGLILIVLFVIVFFSLLNKLVEAAGQILKGFFIFLAVVFLLAWFFAPEEIVVFLEVIEEAVLLG